MPTHASPALRPDIERVTNHLIALYRETVVPTDLTEGLRTMRGLTDQYGGVDAPAPVSGVTITPTLVEGIAAEWIVPQGGSTTDRILYLHGGGWVAGGLNSHRAFAVLLALKTNRSVLVLDYALAPERPFPAGLHECCQGLKWISDNGPNGPEVAQKLCVMGDSAGGNLTTAVCLDAIENHARMPDQAVLISAVLDTTPGATRFPCNDVVCDAPGMVNVMAMYVQDGTPLTDPRISPLHASDALLQQFPPALVQVSSAEFLYPDSLHFAQRLAGLGRRVNLSVWPDMPHVWHAFTTALPEAEQAIDEIAAFLS
jgi:acetyl esterase/lipase